MYQNKTTKSIIVGQNNGTFQNIAVSTDNELLTNTLASSRKSRAVYSEDGIIADTYIMMVPLDGNSGEYPHSQFNSINIDSFSSSITFPSANAKAVVKLGVITRIDAVDSDISWLISETAGTHSTNNSHNIYQNYQPSSIVFKQSGDIPVGAVSNDVDKGLIDVNNSSTLNSSSDNSITPSVGDVILKLSYFADSYDAKVSVLYHSD